MHANDYCIVIAEDDEMLRYCTVRLLKDHGYRIIEARDGQEAVELLERCNDPVHLLITNYNMPRMNGIELARHLRAKHERLAVLLISGAAPETELDADVEFMPKPFNQAELAVKVRELLRQATVAH
jgi:two-component system cell cycle sensor histidine kinase/response regulator CckA